MTTELPKLCTCGHARHAHAGGEGACRPCNLGGRGTCQKFEDAPLEIAVSFGPWEARRRVDRVLIDQAVDRDALLAVEFEAVVRTLTEQTTRWTA